MQDVEYWICDNAVRFRHSLLRRVHLRSTRLHARAQDPGRAVVPLGPIRHASVVLASACLLEQLQRQVAVSNRNKKLYSEPTPDGDCHGQVMEKIGAFFKGSGPTAIVVCAGDDGKPYLYEGGPYNAP